MNLAKIPQDAPVAWKCRRCQRSYPVWSGGFCSHVVHGQRNPGCPNCGACVCEAELRYRTGPLPAPVPPATAADDAPAVLIVEDQPSASDKVAAILGAKHIPYLVARDGLSAWRLLQSRPIAAIVTDMLLPGLDGWQLCRLVKSAPNLSDLPVIFLSGIYSVEEKEAAARFGAAGFLSKPVSADKLLDALARSIRRAA
jgi:CheY-like chemotaxis protein